MRDKKIINNLENLKILREQKNITQLKLSTELHISQELISRYEVGRSFPPPDMLIQLANYFNCSIDYLLGITDIPTSIKNIDKNNIEISNLLTKYNSLSDDNKKHLLSYLEYLSQKK